MEKKKHGGKKLFEPNAISSESYKDQAYLLIKDAILFRRFEEGIIYSQDRIGLELGISRTPVREALLELQKEGYISFLRGRGMMLVPITNDELCEILEMRFYIETIGSRLAAERIDENFKNKLWENFQRQVAASNEHPVNRIKLYRIDRNLHNIIFEAANNRWLLNTVEKLRDRYMRVDSQVTFDTQVNTDAVVQEHQILVEAIIRNDPDGAEAAMKSHLNLSYARNVPMPCIKAFENNVCLGQKSAKVFDLNKKMP